MSSQRLEDAPSDSVEAADMAAASQDVAVARIAPVWLQDGVASLFDLFFPPRCVVCKRRGAWLCAGCRRAIEPIPEPICVRCGRSAPAGRTCADCRLHPMTLHGLRAAARFRDPLREAIHHFKYNGLRALATPLGDILCEAYFRYGLSADLLAPVPLHPSRQTQRGFNQAAALAQRLAARTHLTVASSEFLRVRNTHSQVGLSAAQRRENVRGAFAWHGPPLQGRSILVIDDVSTTGATINSCAEALVAAGAARVWGLTLACEDMAAPDAASSGTR
jgi:ComF family protein